MIEALLNGVSYDILYSTAGQPNIYLGWNIEYDMRNISVIENNDYYVQYYYNASGIGIGKTIDNNNSIEYVDYVLEGSNIIKETHTGSNNYTLEYYYDAYSRIINTEDTSEINPYRYRGYYYDIETGLVMVGQRYYSPELCRFIQPADVSTLNPSSINGLNLYVYANNNPIGRAKSLGITNAGTLSAFNTTMVIPTLKTPNSKTVNGNYWDPHWENKWFDTDWPTFLSLSNDGFEVVNWGLSIYKGSLYFDNNENHSLYVSLGNISVFAGIVFPKDSSKDNKARFGFDASANVIEIGYDGRIIDASVSGLSIGATYLLKDGKFKLEYGYGWWGWSVSIDFIELFKWLFGGE